MGAFPCTDSPHGLSVGERATFSASYRWENGNLEGESDTQGHTLSKLRKEKKHMYPQMLNIIILKNSNKYHFVL